MTRFRRPALAVLIALACALALAPAALAAPVAPAVPTTHARGALGGSGSLDGNLVDGTTGGAPIPNQTVTLAVSGDSGSQQIASTVTDAGGNFHFGDLATDASDIYVASTRYQGVLYSADPITLDSNSHPRETLLAYQANGDGSKIGLARLVIEIREPDVAAGTIGVAELASVVNGNPYTFVGSSTPAGGQPMNLLRFGLPPGAENLATNDDFNQGQNIQVDGGFATTAAVPPGANQFTFAYDYPYSGTRSVFTYTAIYPTEQVVVIAPSDMTITAPRFTSLGAVKSGSQTIQAWQISAIPAGQTASFELSHLPAPGQQNTLSLPWLYVIAGLIALLACGAVGYRLRMAPISTTARGTGKSKRAANASAAATTRAGKRPEEVGSAPKSLLLALARLDREYEAGKLDEDAYRVQRDALKTELKVRMVARGEGVATDGTAPSSAARPAGKGART